MPRWGGKESEHELLKKISLIALGTVSLVGLGLVLIVFFPQ
ncbi:hypothetical protein [Brevibacillus borstelensis]